MQHFIAFVDKDADSCFGVSFPDWPGITSAGDTLDEAIANAEAALAFAAEDWTELTGQPLPAARSFDDLGRDPAFRSRIANSILVAIPFRLSRWRRNLPSYTITRRSSSPQT